MANPKLTIQVLWSSTVWKATHVTQAISALDEIHLHEAHLALRPALAANMKEHPKVP